MQCHDFQRFSLCVLDGQYQLSVFPCGNIIEIELESGKMPFAGREAKLIILQRQFNRSLYIVNVNIIDTHGFAHEAVCEYVRNIHAYYKNHQSC